jgi:hypothetical protein
MAYVQQASALATIPDEGGVWVLLDEDSPLCEFIPTPVPAAANGTGAVVATVAALWAGAMILLGGD